MLLTPLPDPADRDATRTFIRDMLGANVLFKCLSQADRWALSDDVEVRTLGKDDVLFNAGEPADSLFAIADGRVVPTDFVFRFANDANDVIGEVWLFAEDGQDHTRHSGAKADVADTVVLRIPFTALERFRSDSAFLLALIQRHQRFTHWSLQERSIHPGRVVAEVEVPGR